MALIDELKERRTHVLEELNRVEDLRAELADFDRVIAALEPAPTDEQPELFEDEQEDALEQLAREEGEVFADAYAVEIISELTGDPAVEPESGLHGELSPLPSQIAQGSASDPVPEWSGPTLGGGYAPVTNPDADAIAQAHDWYSPEQIAEREKASAKWSGLGTLWGKPKVDA